MASYRLLINYGLIAKLTSMLLSMKEHTCKLLNLPQQTEKLTGMGRPQDLTQKGAGIREGAADDVFVVLRGTDRRTRRTQRDNFQVEEDASRLLRENQSSCLLQLQVLLAFHCSHTYHMRFVSELTFSRFSVSVVTQLQSGWAAVCAALASPHRVSLLCWFIPVEKHCATFLIKLYGFASYGIQNV